MGWTHVKGKKHPHKGSHAKHKFHHAHRRKGLHHPHKGSHGHRRFFGRKPSSRARGTTIRTSGGMNGPSLTADLSGPTLSFGHRSPPSNYRIS